MYSYIKWKKAEHVIYGFNRAELQFDSFNQKISKFKKNENLISF